MRKNTTIGRADGPTSVFLIKKNAKLTLRQKLEKCRYKLKRVYVERTIKANSHTLDEVIDYIVNVHGQQKYDELEENYERVRAEYDKVTEKIRTAKKQEEQFKSFIEILEKAEDTITEFDEEMWLGLVDFVTIKNKEDILVSLKGGMQIAV